MAITVGRTLDEITKKTRELNKEVRGLTGQNRELDKSLKLDSNNIELLNKRANNTTKSIDSLQQRISLLKEKQKEYNVQLERGEISQDQFNKLETDIIRSERQLKQLNNELKETNKTILALPAEKFKKLGDNLESASRAMRPLSIAAAAALAGVTALGLGTVSAADDLQTYADQLGVTAEELQLLNFIALQTDVSQESLRKAFIKTKDAIGGQLLGQTSMATKALDALGISANQFSNDTDAFLAIAASLGEIENSAIQASIANDIFGDRLGAQILTLAKAGGDAIQQYVAELAEIGILSNETVAELAEFDNVLNRIKTGFKTAGSEMGASLLPVMETFAKILEEKILPLIRRITEGFSSLGDGTKTAIIGTLAFVAALAPLLLIGGKISQLIGALAGNLLPKLNQALLYLAANPIVAVIAGIAVLFGILYTTNEKFRNSINKLVGTLSKALGPILEIVGDLLGDILEMLTPILNLLGTVLAKRIEQFLVIIKPVLAVLEFILNIIQKIIDGIMFVFGKGWLWGKGQDESSPDTNVAGASVGSLTVPDFTAPSMTNNNTQNSNTTYQTNAEINVYAAEGQDAESIANEVSNILYSKVTARGGA